MDSPNGIYRVYHYRLNPLGLGVFLVLTGFLFYGVWFNRADLGFVSTYLSRFWATVLFAIPVVLGLRQPRGRRLLIDDQAIIIPRLFNPLVDQTRIPTRDIIKVEVEQRTPMLGLRAIVLQTRIGKFSIYPAFVSSNWAGRRVDEGELVSALKKFEHRMPDLF